MTNNDTIRATRARFDEVTDHATTAHDALAAGHELTAYANMLLMRDALNEAIDALGVNLRAEMRAGLMGDK